MQLPVSAWTHLYRCLRDALTLSECLHEPCPGKVGPATSSPMLSFPPPQGPIPQPQRSGYFSSDEYVCRPFLNRIKLRIDLPGKRLPPRLMSLTDLSLGKGFFCRFPVVCPHRPHAPQSFNDEQQHSLIK